MAKICLEFDTDTKEAKLTKDGADIKCSSMFAGMYKSYDKDGYDCYFSYTNKEDGMNVNRSVEFYTGDNKIKASEVVTKGEGISDKIVAHYKNIKAAESLKDIFAKSLLGKK